MNDAYLGEIRMFAGNFAPAGWALCQGQLLGIAENTALFSLLSTQYGGDGVRTFALPDLRGRFAVDQGQGPNLTIRNPGDQGGTERVALTVAQIPPHNHLVACASGSGTVSSPAAAYWSTDPAGGVAAYSNTANSQMAPVAVAPAGGGIPHDNVQPFLAINYIIALNGIFPSRA